METDVGFTVSVPVVSPLFSDSLMAVTWRVTLEPAGITTRPDGSFTSLATVVVTSSPTLFLLDRISASVLTAKDMPEAKVAGPAGAAGAAGVVGAALDAGAGAAGFGAGFGFGFGLGAGGGGVGAGSGAGAGAAAVSA